MNRRPTASGGDGGAQRRRYIVTGAGANPYFATFNAENEARDAFVRFRLASKSDDSWGQLVAEDEQEHAERLCWFGAPPAAEPAAQAPAPARRSRRRRRFLGRSR